MIASLKMHVVKPWRVFGVSWQSDGRLPCPAVLPEDKAMHMMSDMVLCVSMNISKHCWSLYGRLCTSSQLQLIVLQLIVFGLQVGGWRVDYQNLTFATVRNAGHMVPYVQPERAYYLLHQFLFEDRPQPSLRAQ